VRDLPARGYLASNVDSEDEMFCRWCIIFLMVGLVVLTNQGCTQNRFESIKHHTYDPSLKINLDSKTINACLVCHTAKEMQRGPVLDGFPDWYLKNQLKKFQLGYRGKNPNNRAEYLMGGAIKNIKTDVELEVLADYFSKQTPKPSIRVIRGNIEFGKILYAARCASCHGSEGKGNRQINSPPLNIQEDWFLMDQLSKYISGQRGLHPEDTDGIIMKNSTIDLSLNDMRNIVAYISNNLTVLPLLQKVGPSKN